MGRNQLAFCERVWYNNRGEKTMNKKQTKKTMRSEPENIIENAAADVNGVTANTNDSVDADANANKDIKTNAATSAENLSENIGGDAVSANVEDADISNINANCDDVTNIDDDDSVAVVDDIDDARGADNESNTGAAQRKAAPKTYRKNLYSMFFKRFFDILLSGLALIILSPVIAVVAILVRIKLGKKVIFTQWRLGKNNKPFKLYKFSSMNNKLVDENGDLLPDAMRVTKFGTALRKTSLDELPQLWNIFKGDMSIIGPRPRMISECVFLDEESLNARSLVRPGLTGWAQVNGRNNITFDQVVEYDKEYVSKIGLAMDTKIFFKTIAKVFKRADVNKNGTVSNEFYGDMLLRTGAITQEEYDKKQQEAKEIIKKAS